VNRGTFDADCFVRLINVLCCSVHNPVFVSGLLLLAERPLLQHVVDRGVSICRHSFSPKKTRDLFHKHCYRLLSFCLLSTNVKEDATVILKNDTARTNSRDTLLPTDVNYLTSHSMQCSYIVKKPVFCVGTYI
jgi:hypothetical protein